MSHVTRIPWLVGFLLSTVGAQTFNSGSNGSDGALNLTTPGTVVFDPVALGLNPAGDNIFNFTTINIGPGVTVQLSNGLLRGKPVVWLASGAVTIAGTVDLSGQPGYISTDPLPVSRRPSDPGPGGYPGGVGSYNGSPSLNGSGPGGGGAGNNTGCSSGTGGGAGHGNAGQTACGRAGSSYDNVVLVPFRGGSGGGGGGLSPSITGSGGGGGGGALRIASSVSITITGTIASNGGSGGCALPCTFTNPDGGGGSGGSIHLLAPFISGSGTSTANGGASAGVSGTGAVGRIRIDAFSQQFTGTVNPPATFGSPYNVPLPTNQPMVQVTSVGGIAMPTNATGSFTTPDVVLNSANPVTVNIEARNVPLGTLVTLYLFSEVGPDQTLTSTPLSGTLASSTATLSATFQPSYTRGFVRATW